MLFVHLALLGNYVQSSSLCRYCRINLFHVGTFVISCQVVGISRTAYCFRKRLVDDSKVIHELQDLVEQYPRWGFLKYFMQLRKLGYRWSHKRVQRVYSALKLQLRSKENFVPST